MSDPVATNESEKPGILKRLCQVLCRPSARFSLLTLLVGGFIAGAIFVGGFNTILAATNTEAFCTSCHTMKGNYEEYKKTIHFSNRTGVRAKCPDCHVPHEFIPKMLRKLEARNDVWAQLTGKVDTPEKFEAHRGEMAEREWARMKASGSSTCRGCHDFAGMSDKIQDPAAVKKHKMAAEPGSGKSCIDCHKGIAHELPKDAKE